MSLCCLLQQNLISIQRQKSEVLAATASFYDSFLDVIEFRVSVSTLIHQKIHWCTRCCSCFGFYLIRWRMQKIHSKYYMQLHHCFSSPFCHICMFLWGTCTMNSVLIPHKYVNIIEKSFWPPCISNECAAPPVVSPLSVLLLGPCVRAAQHHRCLSVLLWYCKH